MKKVVLVIVAFATLAFSYPDLVCPLQWTHFGSTSNGLVDSFAVSSYLENIGDSTAISPLYPNSDMALIIGVDSFNIKGHYIFTLSPGYFTKFVDTITVIAAPFSLHSFCDPMQHFQKGWNVVNDVYSYSVNIHPTIKYDSITLVQYDTVDQSVYVHDTTRIKDTLRITTQIHDTLRIVTQIHDTVIKSDTFKITKTDTLRYTKSDTVIRVDTLVVHDTLKTSTGSLAKMALSRPKVYSEVYNVIGKCIWKGYEYEGQLPATRYAQGVHVLIQGSKRKLFRIIYK